MSLKELKEVVKQASIVDLISHYLSVQKKGTVNQCICPFHNDTNPSLKINEEKGIFKCFVCGEAGDSISFVQKFEKVEFVEALKKSATILNIPLDNYLDTPKKNPKKEMGHRVLKAAQRLYEKLARSPQYESVLNNFIKDRKLSVEIAEKFGLGYTPGKSSFYKYLNSIPDKKDKHYALAGAMELGIIKKNERGYYDYFNNRITFPIWDNLGAIVGYGSRVLSNEQQPKYLNSKESFLFNKRNLLYGFHHAKKPIREKDNVLLVEGYMDAIALHQAGFPQTVAIMGIAISEQNARELNRLTQNVYLALDSDDAGLKAMERVNQEFLKLEIIPKFLSFLPHKDPDDYVKAEGAEAFSELMKNAKTFLDYQLEGVRETITDESTPEHKSRALEESFEVLKALGDHISATERAASFAESIGLRTSPEAIVAKYIESLSKNKTRSSQPAPTPPLMEQPPIQEPPHDYEDLEPVQEIIELMPSQKTLIRNTARYPQLFESLNMTEVLDFLSNNGVKQYINRVAELYFESDDGEFERLLRAEIEEKKYPEEIVVIVMGEFFQPTPIALDKKEQTKMIEGMMKHLKIDSLRLQVSSLLAKQQYASNKEESEKLLREIQTLSREIENIKKHRGHL